MNHTWAIAQDTARRASLVRPGHRSLPSAQLAMTQPQATSHATTFSAEQTVMLIPAPAEATPFRTGSSLSSYLARHRTIFAEDMILATPQNWDSVSLLDSVSLVAQDNEREIQFNLRPLPYPLQYAWTQPPSRTLSSISSVFVHSFSTGSFPKVPLITYCISLFHPKHQSQPFLLLFLFMSELSYLFV